MPKTCVEFHKDVSTLTTLHEELISRIREFRGHLKDGVHEELVPKGLLRYFDACFPESKEMK